VALLCATRGPRPGERGHLCPARVGVSFLVRRARSEQDAIAYPPKKGFGCLMTEPLTEIDDLRRKSAKSWSWFEETVKDVLPKQPNWWPPGSANSIGATYFMS
jgi:hypothetical protein